MTENETIRVLKQTYDRTDSIYKSNELDDMFKTAIQALEEIQQYRAIDTVEKFKVLKEKSVPKKMSIGNDNGKSRKCCGNCGCFVLPASSYCSKCGQKLDWR